MLSLFENRPDSTRANGILGPAVGDRVAGIADDARKRLAEAADLVAKIVTTRPALALGTALAVGVVLGWLIKRR
jgi:ElaB/YqjD/DUF883 family membrane-anchored ribosome-binding protein